MAMLDDAAGTIDAPVETDLGTSTEAVETDATEIAVDETADTPAEEQESATGQPEAENETEEQDQQADKEDLSEFKGSAGARMRELYKRAPGLQQLLEKNPAVRDAIASMARRDAGLRELNMSMAEAKEIRERLPNGLRDLNTIERDLTDLGKIDAAFYGGRPQELIEHMHRADAGAAVELFRALPKKWQQLDPDSYDEAFGDIMAATFAKDRVLLRTKGAYDRLKAAGETELADEVAAVHNYLASFGKRPQDDSPAAQRLREQQAEFDRRKTADAEQSYQQFRGQFNRESVKFQRDLIQANPSFKRLPQAISQAKRDRMVEQVRQAIVGHLGKSRAFMAEMNPAWDARDLQKCLEVQRGPEGWRPWIVNKYVRRILAEETPGIVQGTNAANARRRAAAGKGPIATRTPSNGTERPTRRDAQRKNPSDYTVEEIMKGIAPDEVIDQWIRNNRRDATQLLGR